MSIGEIGMLLAMLGAIPYIAAIIRGSVRPSRSSWLVWSVILALAIWGYRASGADDSIWFLVGDFVATFVTFLLSLWRGVGGWTRLDFAVLGLAGLSLLMWQASDITLFVIWGAVMADFLALIPTLKKSLEDPGSEAASAYLFSSLGAFCGLLAVAQWNLTLLFYPAYLFLANFSIALVVYAGQHQVRRLHSSRVEKGSV